MTVITFPGSNPPEQTAEQALRTELRIVEPSPAPEIFCTHLARVHDYGSFTKLLFSKRDRDIYDPNAPEQNIIEVRLTVPTDALQAIYDAIGRHLPPPDGAPAE